MELSVDSLLSPGGLVGNLSYVLLIVSMAMRDIFWLRLIAIGSGLAGIAYDVIWLEDPVGAFWETCFTLVNGAQWARLAWERSTARLDPDEARLKLMLFPTLPNVEFRKLLDIATRHQVPPETVLTVQGEPVDDLLVISDGVADIEVGGAIIATCRAGDLVGEVSYLSHGMATATVTTHTDTRYFSFDKAALGQLLDRSEHLAMAFSSMLSATLARKLVLTSETAGQAPGPAAGPGGR